VGNWYTAIFSALGAIIGLLLKEWVFEPKKLEQARLESERLRRRRYMMNLLQASNEFMTRLNQWLVAPQRVTFYIGSDSSYAQYQLEGFSYRLCKLAGWIYLWPKECDSYDDRNNIEKTIHELIGVLADGHDLEFIRAKRLCGVCGIEFSQEELNEFRIELDFLLMEEKNFGRNNLASILDSPREVQRFARQLRGRSATLSEVQCDDYAMCQAVCINEYNLFRDTFYSIGKRICSESTGAHLWDQLSYWDYLEKTATDSYFKDMTVHVNSLFLDLSISEQESRLEKLWKLNKTCAELICKILDSWGDSSDSYENQIRQKAAKIYRAEQPSLFAEYRKLELH
jgi:hypothetical protein